MDCALSSLTVLGRSGESGLNSVEMPHQQIGEHHELRRLHRVRPLDCAMAERVSHSPERTGEHLHDPAPFPEVSGWIGEWAVLRLVPRWPIDACERLSAER